MMTEHSIFILSHTGNEWKAAFKPTAQPIEVNFDGTGFVGPEKPKVMLSWSDYLTDYSPYKPKYRHQIDCPTCEGCGTVSANSIPACNRCRDSGKITLELQPGMELQHVSELSQPMHAYEINDFSNWMQQNNCDWESYLITATFKEVER